MNDDICSGIEALEQRRRRCMLDADVAGLHALLDDDLVYVHSTGLVDGKASYLGHLEHGRLRYLELDWRELQVRAWGDTAVATGRMCAKVNVMGKALEVQSLFMTVWSRNAQGTWRLRAHQGTPLPA